MYIESGWFPKENAYPARQVRTHKMLPSEKVVQFSLFLNPFLKRGQPREIVLFLIGEVVDWYMNKSNIPFVSNAVNILGQIPVLQPTTWVPSDRSQGKPSGSGFGQLHSRDRDLIPSPQEAEQSEKDVHGLQPPFTFKPEKSEKLD